MAGAVDTVRRRLGKSFSEVDHPRDERGRWSSGDGATVDHSDLDEGDRQAILKVNARLDTHFGAIHEARKQAAEHVKALQSLQKDVAKHHEKALAALDDHHDILEQYEEGVFDPPIADDSDEFENANGLNGALKNALDELKPHVHASKLK